MAHNLHSGVSQKWEIVYVPNPLKPFLHLSPNHTLLGLLSSHDGSYRIYPSAARSSIVLWYAVLPPIFVSGIVRAVLTATGFPFSAHRLQSARKRRRPGRLQTMIQSMQ